MNAQGRQVGFLVVGAGFLGARRAAAIAAVRGSKLVAVCDLDGTAANSVAARHGAEAVENFQEALKRPDIDAVVIATPHSYHFPQALAALEAGKHVLCEKPLAIDPDHGRLLAQRATELRLHLATGFNHRFYPPVADALSLVDARAIGRVEEVRAEIGHQASAQFLKSWHTDVARSGGGTLIDNGPHACDLIRRLLGEVVAAKGYRGESPDLPRVCEIVAYALFRDSDQGFAQLRSSWKQPSGYLTLDIHGSDGWLRVETAPWHLRGVLANGRRIGRAYILDRVAERLFRKRFGCERSLLQEIQAFIAPSGNPPCLAASGWDGCRATEMIDAVYRSHETGEEVRLNPPPIDLPSSSHRNALAGRIG